MSGGSGSTLVTVLAVLTLFALGLLVYIGFVRPRSQMVAYRQAVDMIATDRYRQALLKLTELEGRLPNRIRAEARFFIAFALYRSGDGDGAAYHLTALHRERPDDRDVTYLLAYLRMEQRRYEEAERVLQVVDPTDRDNARLRKLRGIVTFHRARQLLRDDRVDTAAEMFEQAEQFGGFGDDVPDDLRSGHMVLGTRALFEKDLRTARAQFEGLVERARTGSRTDAWTGAMAELGLALATWIERSPGAPTAVESRLTDVVRRLDADAATEEAWPDAPDGPSLIEKLQALDHANGDDDRQAKPTRLLRDIHFLRGMAILRAWVEAENPARERDTMLPRAMSRFACARRLDPRFADPYLVVGMLRYHLARGSAERAQAIAELQQARKFGARDPELLRVLNRERQVEQNGGDDVQMFDRYVADGSLPQEVRSDLVRKLSRYGKARSSDERPELALPEHSTPTVMELKERLGLLGERVSRLIAQRPSSDGPDELTTARDLARALEDDTRALFEQAESIKRREAQLLMILADWLLPEGEQQR
ncbi:MAG: tetratricopeptide repeat protein [Dehalococcoidia bacterium]